MTTKKELITNNANIEDNVDDSSSELNFFYNDANSKSKTSYFSRIVVILASPKFLFNYLCILLGLAFLFVFGNFSYHGIINYNQSQKTLQQQEHQAIEFAYTNLQKRINELSSTNQFEDIFTQANKNIDSVSEDYIKRNIFAKKATFFSDSRGAQDVQKIVSMEKQLISKTRFKLLEIQTNPFIYFVTVNKDVSLDQIRQLSFALEQLYIKNYSGIFSNNFMLLTKD